MTHNDGTKVGPFIVATDDGRQFRCELGHVGTSGARHWLFVDANGIEYVGPPFGGEVTTETVRTLVSAWWQLRQKIRYRRP